MLVKVYGHIRLLMYRTGDINSCAYMGAIMYTCTSWQHAAGDCNFSSTLDGNALHTISSQLGNLGFTMLMSDISPHRCIDGSVAKWALPFSAPRLLSPYTSSVLTLMTRLMLVDILHASRSTCVPYVLFMVNARLLPKELSTCVCRIKKSTQYVNYSTA